MKLMEMMSLEADFAVNLTKKLAPPLVTLLSTEPEVWLLLFVIQSMKV
jgi:hypothetical protein